MAAPPRPANVLAFKPNPSDLEKKVHELAVKSENVRWRSNQYQTHADERTSQRDITDRMMFEVLRTGMLRGEIVAGKNAGEWKVKMVKQMKGRREVGVVTIVINMRKLFVKTVEWEDVK